MTPPLWLSGPIDALELSSGAVLVWHLRIDDPVMFSAARGAPLRTHDLRDLAPGPHAGFRSIRRQSAKLLLARVAAVHPDDVRIGRSAAGAPLVEAPAGWYISVAGRWPHCLIGVSREPLGVDIETITAEPFPPDIFSPTERAQMVAASRTEQTIRWVAKEAHAKRCGNASTIEPAAITTTLHGTDFASVRSEAATSICYMLETAGHILGVAIQPALQSG